MVEYILSLANKVQICLAVSFEFHRAFSYLFFHLNEQCTNHETPQTQALLTYENDALPLI